jgi:hypothetical protein
MTHFAEFILRGAVLRLSQSRGIKPGSPPSGRRLLSKYYYVDIIVFMVDRPEGVLHKRKMFIFVSSTVKKRY